MHWFLHSVHLLTSAWHQGALVPRGAGAKRKSSSAAATNPTSNSSQPSHVEVFVIEDSSDDDDTTKPDTATSWSRSLAKKIRIKNEPAHAYDTALVTAPSSNGKNPAPAPEAADAACMVVQPDDAATDAATEYGAHNTGVKIDDDLEITEQKGMDPSVIAHSRSQCLKHDWRAGTNTQKKNDYCNHCYCFVCQ